MMCYVAVLATVAVRATGVSPLQFAGGETASSGARTEQQKNARRACVEAFAQSVGQANFAAWGRNALKTVHCEAIYYKEKHCNNAS